MITLGIDPGSRNIGLAILDAQGTVLEVWSIRTRSGDWREAFWDILDEIASKRFDRVVVEGVGWYGSRKGMYALNKLVGALWAKFSLDGKSVEIVMPSEKIRLNKKNRSLVRDEHQSDAVSLALVGIKKRWSKRNASRRSPNFRSSKRRRRFLGLGMLRDTARR